MIFFTLWSEFYIRGRSESTNYVYKKRGVGSSRSDEPEPEFSSSSRAELGNFNFRAETELTILKIHMYVKK
jgi:hypothetical protein